MPRRASFHGMSAQSEQLKQRTFKFAIDSLDSIDEFPRTTAGYLIGRQLAKAATSVAANYRATCIARSRAEFMAKLGLVLEEADESEFWLDVASHKKFGNLDFIRRLHGEAAELRAIVGRSLSTARTNNSRTK
jgi:four helix bundle protein